jgi:hypothetical protein
MSNRITSAGTDAQQSNAAEVPTSSQTNVTYRTKEVGDLVAEQKSNN